MMETMTVEQVADLMQVTQPTVYRWVREGALPATRIGRTLRFSREDVESMVSGGSTAAPEHDGAEGFDHLVKAIADAVEQELKRRGTI